ncbi:hypothetical protein [Microcoleus sp. herbarium12]|uniref:hypothetical protein n=1 Tax=Microcoleus sp. herbarium12 TaxID=3055437 RepID=UPI002FD10794
MIQRSNKNIFLSTGCGCCARAAFNGRSSGARSINQLATNKRLRSADFEPTSSAILCCVFDV